MSISIEAAAKRIIVCGFDKVEQHIKESNIGLVCVVMPGISGEVHYGSLPVLDCYHHGIYRNANDELISQARDQILGNLDAIANFLIENPDRNILVHCNAGMHRSPPFAAILIMHLQGYNADLCQAMGAIQKTTPNACLGSIQNYQTFLSMSDEELEPVISDYFLVKYIHNGFLRGEDFETSFNNTRLLFVPTPSKEKVFEVYRRFGLELPTNTAPCDVNNDQRERRPSLPRTPAYP